MAIKTPAWVERKGGFPTVEGWVWVKPNGRTEVLKSASFSAADIAEWHAASRPAPVVEPAPVVQTLHEAPVVERAVTEEEIDWHMEDDLDVDFDEE